MAKSLKHATLVNLYNGRAKLRDVIDNIEQRLIAQGRGAIENGNCRYYTESGCSCAVGIILPKSAKKVVLETFSNGTGVRMLLSKTAAKLGIPVVNHTISEVLGEIQNVHDKAARDGLTGDNWSYAIYKGLNKVRADNASALEKY